MCSHYVRVVTAYFNDTVLVEPHPLALHQNKRDVRTPFCNNHSVTEIMSFLIGLVRNITSYNGRSRGGFGYPPFFQRVCSLAPSNIDIQEGTDSSYF